MVYLFESYTTEGISDAFCRVIPFWAEFDLELIKKKFTDNFFRKEIVLYLVSMSVGLAWKCQMSMMG
jgi:hypothetical protein